MASMDWLRRELREIGLVTLYFLGAFLLLLSLKKLILIEYQIELSIFGTAVISALVVAKVVVVLGKTSFGRGFASQPIVVNVFWRSLLYTAVVFGVTLLERLFDLYRESGDLEASLRGIFSGERTGHFLAMNVGVGLTLLAYNVFHEVDRHVGEGVLRAHFFGLRPSGADEGGESS